MSRNATRLLSRTLATGFVAGAVVIGLSAPAAAHVSVSATGTTAGAYTLLTFSVPHGCEGEATTAVAIQVPEPLYSVTPTVNPNWDVELTTVELDEPITDSHGNEVTERVGEVVYTAHHPLPDGHRDAFELSLRLPEETAGQTLAFPVIQVCGDTEHPWIQIAEEGQDPDALDSPAPFIEVTAADTADADEAPAEAPSEAAAGDDEGSSTGALTYVALALGAVGALLGGLGLLKGRRTP
jgi:uncharacterized protein YcnI